MLDFNIVNRIAVAAQSRHKRKDAGAGNGQSKIAYEPSKFVRALLTALLVSAFAVASMLLQKFLTGGMLTEADMQLAALIFIVSFLGKLMDEYGLRKTP